ncbi:hypothetical protein [Methanimicrococcus hongohii]|uniref:hypothetical protein n=1 Tax=Methanimicrococcus hongohii TaxID=3028295 RepID=UPI00292ED2DA|nr:hypothetical protein [Methanimicrococcus sp. Hf6]
MFSVSISGCLKEDTSPVEIVPPEVIYPEYNLSELYKHSDLVISGVVISATEPMPILLEESENHTERRLFSLFSKEESDSESGPDFETETEPVYETLMKTGTHYSYVTVLIRDCFSGIQHSYFINVKIVGNSAEEAAYQWGDVVFFFLSKGDVYDTENEDPNYFENNNISDDSDYSDYYLIVTPRGENLFVEKIDYHDGIAIYSNRLNENATYSELIRNGNRIGAVSGVNQKPPNYLRIDPTKYGLNPLNKRIQGFYSDRENISFEFEYVNPQTSQSSIYDSNSLAVTEPAVEPVLYANEAAFSLIVDSDLAFYGTVVKEADSFSAYPTNDESISITGSEVIFRIDDLIKGNASGNVSVTVYSGHFDGSKLMIRKSVQEPISWDLKEGTQYLIYLEESYIYNGELEPMIGGLYPVITD